MSIYRSTYRLESWGDGIARLWDGDRVVAMVASGYGCWTARPCNVAGASGWAFTCPTRRQAVAAVTAWLQERSI